MMKKEPAQFFMAKATQQIYQGKLKQAIETLKKAIKIQPHQVNAINELGVAFLHNNQFDQAIQQFRKALQIHPKLANVYKNLGNAYRFKGQYDQALCSYYKALQINQDLSEVYDEIGLVHISKDKNINKAIESFQRAIQKDSMNINALNNLSMAYFQLGDIQRAQLYNMKALTVNENNHTANQIKAKIKQN